MTQAVAQGRPGSAHGGTVFDIGYQPYTGVREGRSRGRRALFKDGVRTALAVGRGGRAKILPWLFIVALSALGLVFSIVAAAANAMGGPGSAEKGGIPSHSDFNGVASIMLFVFAAVVAPDLLSPDKRNGVINLYRVRPVTGTDYIASRWAAFLSVMLIAVWLPQVVLFLGLSGSDPVPMDYLTKHWLDIPRFILAGAAMAVYATTLAMLAASFTTRRAYASVFLVGLFVISAPFTVGLAHEIEGAAGQWVSMFDLTAIPVHVNDIIFGQASEMTEHAPARKLGSAVLVGWYFAWTVIPGLFLWSRYRKLAS
jgi:ABC-type transport system involved in multi-copper enzyme maturation permease subunit